MQKMRILAGKAAVFGLIYMFCMSTLAVGIHDESDVSPQEMQWIYDEVKTPYKQGVVLVPDSGQMVDNPNVFCHDGAWYMAYIVFDGNGYETRLASSEDLVHWKKLGTILPRGQDGSWDSEQADGCPQLMNPTWGGDYRLSKASGKYWMTYIGGSKRGYETDPLAISMAWTDSPSSARPWTKLGKPVLQCSDADARMFERKTLFKSFVVEDETCRLGGRYVMYYNAKQSGVWIERIGMAVSDDMVRWRRFGLDAVIDDSVGARSVLSGDPMVQKIGDLWVMFYFGCRWKADVKGAFNTFAVSKDLVHWTKWTGRPLIEPSENWDRVHAHKPWVIKVNGVVYHFYCAVGDKGRCIALATSRPLGKKSPTAHTWRIKSSNVDVFYNGENTNGASSIRLSCHVSGSGQKHAWVSFGDVGISRLLGSWIPPYVGIRARRVMYDWKVVGDSGCAVQLVCGLQPSAQNISFPLGGTGSYSHSLDLRRLDRLSELKLLFDGGSSSCCEFVLSNFRVEMEDGTFYDVLNASAPMYRYGMIRPLVSHPVRSQPSRPRIQFGVGMGWYQQYWTQVRELGRFMKDYLPEYDIVLSLDGTPEPFCSKTMQLAPDNVFFQYQKGRYDLRFAAQNDALIKDMRGKMQPVQFNSAIGTHPLLRDAYEDQIAYAGSVGINSLQQYDYVWYWPNGPWGFDEATRDAFREDLQGKDEGLVLGATHSKPERLVRFWEYYEDYQGKGSRLRPCDLGFESWGMFVSRFSTPLERKLHWMLVTYEWLRHAQRFGNWAYKYCYGAKHDYLLNGEGTVNGNDHVYLLRLKNTGVVSPEYFHQTPKNICGIYHSSGRLIREASRYGKQVGATVETSCGGGSTQPYWSGKTAYVICYVLSALGFKTLEYDHVPDCASWHDYVDKTKPGLWMNLAHGLSSARGYRQAKIDGARKLPFGKVLYLSERTIARDGGSREFEERLSKMGVNYERTDPQELQEVMDYADTIIVSPKVVREDVRALLGEWEKSECGRKVIDEDAMSDKTINDLPRLSVGSNDGTAFVLPFRCRGFSAVAIFNRMVVEAVDCERWRKEVVPPVMKRRTYDRAKLMYPDNCPNTVSSAIASVSNGVYRVYSTITGEETSVVVKNGCLPLTLGHRLCDVVYYGVDTPDFASFLDCVKVDRNISAEFFDERD